MTNNVDLFLAQGQLLLSALLDDAFVESTLKTFLVSFQLVRGELIVRKNVILSTADQQLMCRLLQQLKALKSVGDYYSINPLFETLLDGVILCASRLGGRGGTISNPTLNYCGTIVLLELLLEDCESIIH